jgi:hypothetical protein
MESETDLSAWITSAPITYLRPISFIVINGLAVFVGSMNYFLFGLHKGA